MLFSSPISFDDALDSIRAKGLLPTSLTSRELQQLSSAILERARFSAQVTNADFLQQIDREITNLVQGSVDSATTRLRLKEYLQSISYQPNPEKRGGIQDLSSDSRLNLILETNTQMAQGYGYWKQGQDTDVLDAFPAQELIRVIDTQVHRDWASRWQEAGGQFYGGGRMIALKDAEVWENLGTMFDDGLGNPYPPFAFNSGMDIQDISRAEAVDLGVMQESDTVKTQDRGFNDGLQASTDNLGAEFQNTLLDSLGDAYEIVKGILQLKSN